MERPNIGDRVAVLSATLDEFIGFGVYEGPTYNPKITLDDGEIHWGHNVAWMPIHRYELYKHILPQPRKKAA